MKAKLDANETIIECVFFVYHRLGENPKIMTVVC